MLVETFIVLVVVLIVASYIRQYYGEVEIVRSKTDGRRYIVRKLPDRQEAAEVMARINQRLIKVVSHMERKYPKDPDVQRLVRNFNPDALSEGGMEVGFTSYSVNKGEKIVLCIRQSSTDAFVDENVLTYVALHELAHLMTEEVGHPKPFWTNFKRIASQAVAIGVYHKADFQAQPQAYCGIEIKSSVI
jgi:hypothetical protein